MDKLEDELRKKAVYFAKAKWPDLVQMQLPQDLIPGKMYLVAILEVE